MRILPAKLISNYKCLTPSRKITAKNNTSASSLKCKYHLHEEKAKDVKFLLSNIFSLPKAKTAINWGRSVGDRRLCSPFKNSLFDVTKKKRRKD
jgi:hypothetical protein